MCDAIVVVGAGDPVRHGLELGHRVAHGDADAGPANKLDVVTLVSNSKDVCWLDSKACRQQLGRISFPRVRDKDLAIIGKRCRDLNTLDHCKYLLNSLQLGLGSFDMYFEHRPIFREVSMPLFDAVCRIADANDPGWRLALALRTW